jgi:hypothetical protein
LKIEGEAALSRKIRPEFAYLSAILVCPSVGRPLVADMKSEWHWPSQLWLSGGTPLPLWNIER